MCFCVQVQKCLCSLLQHQLIRHVPNRTATHCLYEIDMNKILWFSRYPKFIHSAKVWHPFNKNKPVTFFIKIHFEDSGELIVENLLLQGQNLMSDCVQAVCEKLDDGTKDESGDFKIR